MLVPLWFWSFAYGVFANYLGGYFLDLKPAPLDFYNVFWTSLHDGHQYVFNFASWFIGPLFFAYVIVAFMRKYIFSKLGGECLFFIFGCSIGVYGFYLSSNFEHNSFYILVMKTFVFVGYFVIGRAYRLCLEKYDTLNSLCYFFLLLASWNVVKDFFVEHQIALVNGLPALTNTFDGYYWFGLLLPLWGIAFWLRISKLIANEFTDKSILCYLGSNTSSVMYHHMLSFMLLKVILVSVMVYMDITLNEIDFYKYRNDMGYMWQLFYGSDYIIFFMTLLLALCINYCVDLGGKYAKKYISYHIKI